MNVAMAVEGFREEVATEIVKQLPNANISERDRGRIARVMGGRGWFNKRRRERVIDEAVKQLHSEQLIEVTPDGVQAAIDWDGIASFLERILPLILNLVKLFGG